MIPVLNYRMQGVPLCACVLEVRLGWGHESEEDRGLVHLLEHGRLLGSTEYPDIDEVTQPYGVTLDGFTERESSALVFTALADDVARILPVALACMFHPTFEPTRLELEKKVVAGAVSSRSDFAPWNWARLKLDDLLFGADELMALGSSRTVNGFGRARLIEWHDRFDHPANVRLIVAGDIDHRVMKGALDRIPGKRPGAQTPVLKHQAIATSCYCDEGDGGRPELYLGFRLPGTCDPATHLLRTILGNYPGSRLWRGFRTEESLAYMVDTTLRLQPDGCRFAIYAGLSDTRDLPRVWEKLNSILADLRTDGPTEAELAWAKRVARIELLRSVADPEKAVRWLREALCAEWGEDINGSQFVQEFEAALLSQSCAQVRAAALRTFRRDQAALSVVGQIGSWDPATALESLSL